MEAALHGAQEIGFTVLSMTLRSLPYLSRSCSWPASWAACSANLRRLFPSQFSSLFSFL